MLIARGRGIQSPGDKVLMSTETSCHFGHLLLVSNHRRQKFLGHRPVGSGEEDFLRFISYMGIAAIMVMWPGPFEQTFVSPSHGDSIWNLSSIGPVVPEEKMFKSVDDRQTDRRTTEAYLSYKLTNEPSAQVSLKNYNTWFSEQMFKYSIRDSIIFCWMVFWQRNKKYLQKR